MPGLPKEHLTPAQRKRFQKAEQKVDKTRADLHQARTEWAALVRELGISAVARELDLSAQAVSQRVRIIEADRGHDG